MPRKDHISTLDGLRAVAALLIVWVHIPEGVLFGWMDRLSRGLPLGYLGVDIFFVLSGFLITRILLVDRQRGVPLSYFLIRRFLRIFPIYYLTIVVLLIVDPRPALAWCAAYLSNFYFAFNHTPHPLRHAWSLAVEEHFYLIWPFVVYWLPIRRSRAALIWLVFPMAIFGAAGLILLKDHLPAEPLIYRGSMFRVLSLGLGALLAYHEEWLRGRGNRSVVVSLAVLSFGAGCLGMAVVSRGSLYLWHPLIRLISCALLSLGVVGMAIVLRDAAIPPIAVLRSRPMRFIGQISYGLYLYHYPIYYAFGLFDAAASEAPKGRLVAGAVTTTAAVTIASYYLIEKPLLRLKDRYRSVGGTKRPGSQDVLAPLAQGA